MNIYRNVLTVSIYEDMNRQASIAVDDFIKKLPTEYNTTFKQEEAMKKINQKYALYSDQNLSDTASNVTSSS